jgi:hypothetical protein
MKTAQAKGSSKLGASLPEERDRAGSKMSSFFEKIR